MDGEQLIMSRKPTYDLTTIQAAFKTVDSLIMTGSARQGAFALGFSDQDVVDAVQALVVSDFYKSMPPTASGFTAMQDVYKPTFNGVGLYIKFQILPSGELILSFKEK